MPARNLADRVLPYALPLRPDRAAMFRERLGNGARCRQGALLLAARTGSPIYPARRLAAAPNLDLAAAACDDVTDSAAATRRFFDE